MSFSGLLAFFKGDLRWSQLHSLLGPLSLDIAAIVVYGFALDRIEKGESGAQFRLMALVLVGLSAFINWRGALGSGNVAEELFFPVMSVMVYWMAHAILGAARRDVGRAQHGYDAKARVEPLPPFGLLVWVPGIGAPWTAIKELRAVVRKRLAKSTANAGARKRPVPAASDVARAVASSSERPALTASASASPLASAASAGATANASRPLAPVANGGGHGSQSAAIRLALATLRSEQGCEPAAADVVAYLARNGRVVPIGRVNDVMRRDRFKVVGQEEAAG
jgi:hypothetical protein